MTTNLRVVVLALAVATGLTGCATLSYYAQSTIGHLGVMSKRQSLDRLLDDPETPPKLRTGLRQAVAIRAFASRALYLPDNDSYRSYTDLGQDYVVWNVTAAPELSVEPVTWCYLVVGCVAYRGYYAQRDASRFAAGLRAKGNDVYVAGVRAYSTLGWFDDPVLNTMLGQSPTYLAALIFHELAHQQLYFSGDTAFNESFAVTVEREGVRRWLVNQDQDGLARYQESRVRRQQFIDLVLATKNKLDRMFRSDLPVEQKRTGKRAQYDQLRSSYVELKHGWGGDSGYDPWFATDLNNAKLALVATYNDLVPQLTTLLAAQGGDLRAFYARVGELQHLDIAERRARLAILTGETSE